MLLSVLRNVFPRRNKAEVKPKPSQFPDPLFDTLRMMKMHARAPVEKHVDILFNGHKIGAHDFNQFFEMTSTKSGSYAPPLKAFRSRWASANLIQYFLYAGSLPGLRVECGVFRGVSALRVAVAAREKDPTFDGTGFFLIDSFEGLGEFVELDQLPEKYSPIFMLRKKRQHHKNGEGGGGMTRRKTLV